MTQDDVDKLEIRARKVELIRDMLIVFFGGLAVIAGQTHDAYNILTGSSNSMFKIELVIFVTTVFDLLIIAGVFDHTRNCIKRIRSL